MEQLISINMVNIEGINKEVLLESLWNNSKPIPFYRKYKVSPPNFDINKAMKQVKEDGFADFILGRLIKINIQNNIVNPELYNENNGPGKLQHIIKNLKKNKKIKV